MAITHALRFAGDFDLHGSAETRAFVRCRHFLTPTKLLNSRRWPSSPRLRNHAEIATVLPVQELNQVDTETELGWCVAQV
jgi:hypothetical protein